MAILGGSAVFYERGNPVPQAFDEHGEFPATDREFFVDNLLVRIHPLIEKI